MKIYIDTDVFISAQISKTGAAYWLIYKVKKGLYFPINSETYEEYLKVLKRLEIDDFKINKTVNLGIFHISKKNSNKDLYEYLNDSNDIHILNGAIANECKFIVTYNIKNYKTDKIMKDFDIKVISPGELLQYLRFRRIIK